MINARHTEIRDNHSAMEAMNKQVQMENQLATRLRKQLEHEKVVLLERRAVSIIHLLPGSLFLKKIGTLLWRKKALFSAGYILMEKVARPGLSCS